MPTRLQAFMALMLLCCSPTGYASARVWSDAQQRTPLTLNNGPQAVDICPIIHTLSNPGGIRITMADMDGNGQLDLVGVGDGPGFVYFSNGPLPFIDEGVQLPWASQGSVECADYDHDGDLDILSAGQDGSTFPSSPRTRILRQDDVHVYVDTQAALPGIREGNATWGDFDNDGRLDVLVVGETSGGGSIAEIYRNTGSGFSPISAGLPGVHRGEGRWGDFDNDGDLDVLLTGNQGTLQMPLPLTEIYSNDNGTFVPLGADLLPVWKSSVAWGDYDYDGDLDIGLTGATGAQDPSQSAPAAAIYRNDGNGVFTNIGASLAPFFAGDLAWGDFNSDALPDLVVMGLNDQVLGSCRVYRNSPGLGFVLEGTVSPFSVGGDLENETGLYLGNAEWGPRVSNAQNSTTNLMVCGLTTVPIPPHNGQRHFFYDVCEPGTSNANPSAPTGLIGTVNSNQEMRLRWTRSTDVDTIFGFGPSLSYNVRVGTTPGGEQIVSANALPGGTRKVARLGNAQTATMFTVKGVTGGPPYYWSVQAIDAIYAGGPFASGTITTIVGVENERQEGIAFDIEGGNPSVAPVRFRLALDRRVRCRVRVFDVAGRVVGTVLDEVLEPGEHRPQWLAKGVPAGFYLARLQVDGQSLARRLVIGW